MKGTIKVILIAWLLSPNVTIYEDGSKVVESNIERIVYQVRLQAYRYERKYDTSFRDKMIENQRKSENIVDNR